MEIDKIIIIILISALCLLQIRFLCMERNTTILYLYKKLQLGKNYYLKVDCIDNQVVLILVNVLSNEKHKVNKIIEKGFHMYFYCESYNLIFNTITKKMQVN